MDMTSRVSNTTVAAFMAFAGMALLAMLNWGNDAFVSVIMREDGLVETVTAGMYLLGMIACGIAVYRKQNLLLAGIWLFLCFMFLGEETSWFQRVFDYSVPAVENMSNQAEFNLHNLLIFGQSRIIVSDGVSLSLASLLTSQNIFRLGFTSYFLAIPVMCLVPVIRRFVVRLGYVIPSRLFLVTAWSVIGAAFLMTVTTVEPVKDYVAEMRELFYALTIFFYVSGLVNPDTSESTAQAHYAR